MTTNSITPISSACARKTPKAAPRHGARDPQFRRRRRDRNRARRRRRHVPALHPRDVPDRSTQSRPHRRRGARRRSRRSCGVACRMSWRATVLTLFPEMFPGPLGRFADRQGAGEKNLWSLEVRDIREHGLGKHRTRRRHAGRRRPGHGDARRCGGGAVDAARASPDAPAIYLSPRGSPLTQARVRAAGGGPGRDPALRPLRGAGPARHRGAGSEEVSLGDFVLAGGEIAAMALIEAVVRLIPGVLGDAASRPRKASRPACSNTPIHPAPELRGNPGRANRRKSRRNRPLAAAQARP
jgi:tRNA (guanine37-N1)-methyltransferase